MRETVIAKQQEYEAMQVAAQQAVAQQVSPRSSPAAAGRQDDLITKLNELAQLKAQASLSEEEFTAAKAKLLS